MQRAYFRILSQHLIDCVKDGCGSVTQSKEALTGNAFDLYGSGREFVTGEMARKLFEPLLRSGAIICC